MLFRRPHVQLLDAALWLPWVEMLLWPVTTWVNVRGLKFRLRQRGLALVLTGSGALQHQ